MRKLLLNPFAMFVLGLCAGILSRFSDIYTQNLGEIFSQMAVWILLGTLISIYSETPRRAAANTLTFCLGMLITYYAVAALSHGVYDKIYVLFFVDVQRGTAAGVLRKQVWTTTGRAPMSE